MFQPDFVKRNMWSWRRPICTHATCLLC